MRKYLLLPLLLTACGADDPEIVERAFAWTAPLGQEVTAAAFLPNGEIFVGLSGTVARGMFLSPRGGVLHAVDLSPLCTGCGAIRPTQPLIIGDTALFGSHAGGEPLLRIDPAARRIRHLPLENPRGLRLGMFRLDGRRAAAKPGSTQMLLPGEQLLTMSVEGIVTAINPTPGISGIEAVAHVRDDVFTFIDAEGRLHGWRESDAEVATFGLSVSRIAGGDGVTVIGLRQPGAIDLYLYADPLEPLGQSFAHEIEVAVAPVAGRIVVGVLDTRLLDAEETSDAPAPRTALVLDRSGKVLGTATAPAPITAVHISPEGKNALVAHELGVLGFTIK